MQRILSAIVLTIGITQICSAESVQVVVSSAASPPETIAARELANALGKLYPNDEFAFALKKDPRANYAILVGTPGSMPGLSPSGLQGPESYVVHAQGKQATIVGADPRGVMYGVYGLLEKLGCGFYLTGDSLPEVLPGAFSLDAWDFADHPLVANRYVFNWHNFLSGCTGWDYADWESWIVQSQKMGFNTVMVHAYGNNPMFTYTFNGIAKEVGYYGTSRKGRDWGRQHINDVRRIPGGEIFDGPEFGSEAALVPDGRRIEAAQSLMKRVFECAEQRGMNVCFAIDIDTPSVLLQDMITTLPESARFSNGSIWLPRPGTNEGAAFYRAQVEALFELYPEIDTLALWRRSHAAEWGKLQKPEQLPVEWRAGYQAIIRKNPEVAQLEQAVCSYALNKVVAAFRKALGETGRPEVQLAVGSWENTYIPALSVFLPEDVTIMPLDAACMKRYRGGSYFDVPKRLAKLETGKGRIQPIIWAHHDDGEYIGRPMKSHEKFSDRLNELQARGYGIIHWMKRPLDLHFRNHEKQVWASTRNETDRETCERAARHWFGESNAEIMSGYLYDWWTQAPIFGRVTTDKFFHGKEYIPDPEKAMNACRKRLDTLANVELSKMPAEGQSKVAYFKKLEAMIISFCEVHELAFRPAIKAMEAGSYTEAQRLLESTDPAETMRIFSRLSQLDGGDRTEEAMVLSLGTRWLTDYIAARQKVGLEPLRINFAPTQQEALAQSPGAHTFFIDDGGAYWSVRGEKETKGTIVATGRKDSSPIRDAGLLIEMEGSIPMSAIVPIGGKFRPGRYEATLVLEGTGEGSARLGGEGEPTATSKAFSVGKGTTGEVKVLGRLEHPGQLSLEVAVLKGKPLLAGAVLRRIEEHEHGDPQ